MTSLPVHAGQLALLCAVRRRALPHRAELVPQPADHFHTRLAYIISIFTYVCVY